MLNHQNVLDIIKNNFLVKNENNDIYDSIDSNIYYIINNIISENSNLFFSQLQNNKKNFDFLININLPHKYKTKIIDYFLDCYLFYEYITIENDKVYNIIFDLNNITNEISKLIY